MILRLLGIRDHVPLGDLDGQSQAMRVPLPDGADHALDECRVIKVQGGQVDGDFQVNSHPVPIDRLGRGGREHPVPQGLHQAPNLGQPMIRFAESGPLRGWCQRIKASTPQTFRVSISSLG